MVILRRQGPEPLTGRITEKFTKNYSKRVTLSRVLWSGTKSSFRESCLTSEEINCLFAKSFNSSWTRQNKVGEEGNFFCVTHASYFGTYSMASNMFSFCNICLLKSSWKNEQIQLFRWQNNKSISSLGNDLFHGAYPAHLINPLFVLCHVCLHRKANISNIV